jgi:hypothetical protein
MAVCFKEDQRILSHFLRMWWKYERTSFSAVGAYMYFSRQLYVAAVNNSLVLQRKHGLSWTLGFKRLPN